MHKILIADDSLTIQKVIKITLANEAFELAECLSDEELDSSLQEEKPNIVLLDFNLSEDKTGYELAKDIIDKLPEAKILMLFGTFDTIDEALLKQSGVDYKIVKPFDGNKFITLCHAMRDSLGNSGADLSSSLEEELPGIIEEDIEDEWVMDSPSVEIEDFQSEENLPEVIEEVNNELEASVQDWGMDIPGVIGEPQKSSIEIPDVISESESNTDLQLDNEEKNTDDDIALPSNEDLEFPDMSIDISIEDDSPKLVPIDLSDIEEDEEVEQHEIIPDNNEENLLEAAIEDEIDDEDLWSADELEESEHPIEEVISTESETSAEDFVPMDEEDLPHITPHNLSEVKESFEDISKKDSFADLDYVGDAPSDFPSDVMEVIKPAAEVENLNFSDDQLENILREKMTPMIEKLVKEYCQKNIEKIAWEVIPDLAENIIKKEIETITKSVMDS